MINITSYVNITSDILDENLSKTHILSIFLFIIFCSLFLIMSCIFIIKMTIRIEDYLINDSNNSNNDIIIVNDL